jgi:hypothetical protein
MHQAAKEKENSETPTSPRKGSAASVMNLLALTLGLLFPKKNTFRTW